MSASAQMIGVASTETGFWSRYVRPLAPGESSPTWHVSPAIDMAAYHFSWVWILVPMLLAGQSGLYYLYALMMGANLAHRLFRTPKPGRERQSLKESIIERRDGASDQPAAGARLARLDRVDQLALVADWFVEQSRDASD
jgi:hypothetical protein